MLLRQHTAAGKHTPLQPFNTIAISLMTSWWKAALGRNVVSSASISNSTFGLLPTIVTLLGNAKCFFSFLLNICRFQPFTSTIHHLLPISFQWRVYFQDLPLSMDISPHDFRPVLPFSLKHDRTRHAVVTQLDFFFEQGTNTCTRIQTKTHCQTSSDHATWKDIQCCHCWNIQEWSEEMTVLTDNSTKSTHKNVPYEIRGSTHTYVQICSNISFNSWHPVYQLVHIFAPDVGISCFKYCVLEVKTLSSVPYHCSVMFYPLWLLYVSAHLFIAL